LFDGLRDVDNVVFRFDRILLIALLGAPRTAAGEKGETGDE
jgi:hypothetical protein